MEYECKHQVHLNSIYMMRSILCKRADSNVSISTGNEKVEMRLQVYEEIMARKAREVKKAREGCC